MALALAALGAPLGSGATLGPAVPLVPLVVFGAFFFFRFTFSGPGPGFSDPGPSLLWEGFGFSALSILSLALDFGVPAFTEGGAGAEDFAAEGFA